MKSGIPHLRKRFESGDSHEDSLRSEVSAELPSPEPTGESQTRADSDLDRPIWSVVSFDRSEGRNLTYSQAAVLLRDLDAKGVSGLCLVTDSAAERLGS
ncbi:MAG: hypothetical protein ABR530_07110 [Pyrinomonadaceae bacterium]